MNNPYTRLNVLTSTESLTLYERRGSIPWPSCTNDAVKRTEKGTMPLAYSMTNTKNVIDSACLKTFNISIIPMLRDIHHLQAILFFLLAF